MRVLERPTRNLFFTGKGGVGKTSTSCAVAVALADRGKAVLLVSTDPASNLDEVFDTSLANGPVAIAAVPGLHAMNVDPEAAAAAYRERVVGPYRALLPADAVASIEEQLAGACTVEIAAFDEFAKLIGDRDVAARYDHIVFDTAPTGHTLRLLALPAAWSGFFGSSVSGTSCVGPLQGMAAQRDLYAAAVATLSRSLGHDDDAGEPARALGAGGSRTHERGARRAGRTQPVPRVERRVPAAGPGRSRRRRHAPAGARRDHRHAAAHRRARALDHPAQAAPGGGRRGAARILLPLRRGGHAVAAQAPARAARVRRAHRAARGRRTRARHDDGQGRSGQDDSRLAHRGGARPRAAFPCTSRPRIPPRISRARWAACPRTSPSARSTRGSRSSAIAPR